MLPTSRITARLTGTECPVWRLFADGGFKRQVDGTEMSSWGVAVVSPENFVRVICGPVVCDPRVSAFLGATSYSNKTAELTDLAEALRWAVFFIPRRARFRILVFPHTRLVSSLLLPTPKKTLR